MAEDKSSKKPAAAVDCRVINSGRSAEIFPDVHQCFLQTEKGSAHMQGKMSAIAEATHAAASICSEWAPSAAANKLNAA